MACRDATTPPFSQGSQTWSGREQAGLSFPVIACLEDAANLLARAVGAHRAHPQRLTGPGKSPCERPLDESGIAALLRGDRLVEPPLEPSQSRREWPRDAMDQAAGGAERRILRQQLGLQAQAVRVHEIVRVHARDQLAAAVRQAEIQRGDETMARSAHHADAAVGPACAREDRRSRVGRRVVDAHHLVRWGGALGEHAAERIGDRGGGILRWEQDADQRAGQCPCSPNTSRIASAISPRVARAFTAATMFGTRFPAPCAARFSSESARVEAGVSRCLRYALTRAICCSSSAGSIRSVSIGASSAAANSFTPTTICFFSSTSFCALYAASSISRCGNCREIASTIPPISSILRRYSTAFASSSSVSDSSAHEPPNGSMKSHTPLS